ncbi:DNase I-like protein [Cryphonectria parasitica EP155]|uniref:DNase I-like protein n=1 Tax=Cryphonectria parasitica (strain ATCC 38755 / EP155) TaxID=660469 RepID=A0A9P4Y916_CRYP1|nr:DNase I-like protein [Cryphonectria parasitica EP155]KAF3768567.1 DNase I-like protein [Cryphonectria parasitica EP155]
MASAVGPQESTALAADSALEGPGLPVNKVPFLGLKPQSQPLAQPQPQQDKLTLPAAQYPEGSAVEDGEDDGVDDLDDNEDVVFLSKITGIPSFTSSSSPPPAAAMDVLVLTFNCGKVVIDVAPFATHLRTALQQKGQAGRNPFDNGQEDSPTLPDLVVFSLQEIAPLTSGYLGGHFLAPYLNAFKDALNLAALDLLGQPLESQRPSSSSSSPSPPDPPYKLVEARNVGMTAIMMFARQPEAIARVEVAECAFGIANMGNKGAIALRVLFTGNDEDHTADVTFVATHLAAMEYNLRRRNANWASICSSCLFEDPKKTLPDEFHFDEPDGGEDIPPETEEERHALLTRRQNEASMPSEYAAHLQDISIFKPGTHLFVAGDLNYRISTTTPPALATFPTMDTYMDFLERDQLTQEKAAGRTLHGLSEAPIDFPPTYKIKHLSPNKVAEAVNKEELIAARAAGREDEVIPWKWASHRWPGWCDRVLFLDIPDWVKERYTPSTGASSSEPAPEIKIHAYSSLPTVMTSDHQAVFLRASVPLLVPGELVPQQPLTIELSPRDVNDPRLTLPVPIDTGAFARRAAARKREIYTGMTALFFSTKEGLIVTVAVVGLALWSWWLYQGFF